MSSTPGNWYVYRAHGDAFWKLDHGKPAAAVKREGPMSYGAAVRRRDELNDRAFEPVRTSHRASERTTRPLFDLLQPKP